MPEKITSKVIIELLRVRHRGEVFVEELRGGSGTGSDNERRMDAWAMHHYPSKGNRRTAYEVKISRGDFLRDIKQLLKHRPALTFSNEFYFVAPEGMIKPEELPLFAGLLEVVKSGWVQDPKPFGYVAHHLRSKVPAPWRDTTPPNWRFVVSLVRSVQKQERKRK